MKETKKEKERIPISNITLLKGDCLELIRDIPDNSIDLILTDPPYGIDYQSRWRKDKSIWKPKIQNDKKPFLDWIKLIKPKIKQTGGGIMFHKMDCTARIY